MQKMRDARVAASGDANVSTVVRCKVNTTTRGSISGDRRRPLLLGCGSTQRTHGVLEAKERWADHIAGDFVHRLWYVLCLALPMGCSLCAYHVCVRGLSTFLEMLRGRNVHVFSDNTSAEHNTSKGRAKSFDHTMMIHSIWCAAAIGMSAHVMCEWLALW